MRFRIPEDAKAGMIYGGCNCGNCHITILPTVIYLFAPGRFLFAEPDSYISAQVILGYRAGNYPAPKERKYQAPLFL